MDLREALKKYGAGLTHSAGWEPRLTCSPSQLNKADDCLRAWALAYLYGLRSKRTMGAPVGLATHWLMQQYHGGRGLEAFSLPLPERECTGVDEEGEPVYERDLTLEPEDDKLARDCARAILPHVPEPGDLVFPELQFTLNTQRLTYPAHAGRLDAIVWPGREQAEWDPKCAIDLTDAGAEIPEIFDYKTTAGSSYKKKDGTRTIKDRWCYVPTIKELLADVQFNLYCASTWQTLHELNGWTGPIRGSWIYVSKLQPVMARKVSALWLPKNSLAQMQKWLGLTSDLIGFKREPPETYLGFPLPKVPDGAGYRDIPCNKYGGCPYRYDKGGPCAGIRKADDNNG